MSARQAPSPLYYFVHQEVRANQCCLAASYSHQTRPSVLVGLFTRGHRVPPPHGVKPCHETPQRLLLRYIYEKTNSGQPEAEGGEGLEQAQALNLYMGVLPHHGCSAGMNRTGGLICCHAPSPIPKCHYAEPHVRRQLRSKMEPQYSSSQPPPLETEMQTQA